MQYIWLTTLGSGTLLAETSEESTLSPGSRESTCPLRGERRTAVLKGVQGRNTLVRTNLFATPTLDDGLAV